MASLSDFHYDLPPELIAQRPAERREGSRLMVVRRERGTIEHLRFSDLPELLDAGDLLVLNDTRVVPARVFARKETTGGRVELLFHGAVEEDAGGRWTCRCLTRSSKPVREGARLVVGDDAVVVVEQLIGGGEAMVSGEGSRADQAALLQRHGQVPLPPYIQRGPEGPNADDSARYQTVFARTPGAVAAPTAGLHFTEEMLDHLAGRDVGRTHITLHVGPGTFQPVRDDDFLNHQMMAERYRVSEEAAAAIAAHRPPNGRVLAVGTTAVRTLEWVGREDGVIRPGEGDTALFVTPGYSFKVVDRLLTNFHLPGSTLILLVAAFVGRDLLLAAYREAVERRYRFYSYGDAMLVL